MWSSAACRRSNSTTTSAPKWTSSHSPMVHAGKAQWRSWTSQSSASYIRLEIRRVRCPGGTNAVSICTDEWPLSSNNVTSYTTSAWIRIIGLRRWNSFGRTFISTGPIRGYFLRAFSTSILIQVAEIIIKLIHSLLSITSINS